MKIVLNEVLIKDLVKDYEDKLENGVVGYNGKLDIRPKYQREFVYDDKKKKAVINTVLKSFPLNVMYWVRVSGDEEKEGSSSYEVLDGQQRTISICEYVKGNYSVDVSGNPMYFHNLTKDEQDKINNYKLMIYFCSGTDKEKLDWFKTINIAGEKLTDQELRNAVYTGSWLSDAKEFLSRTNCAGHNLSIDYISGSPIRQELLEKALNWISSGNIEDYMSKHQNDSDASDLRKYFKNLISWIEETFTEKRKEMKQVDWGFLYNKYKDASFDKKAIEEEISKLMTDEDVSKPSGIYPYILTREEKFLNIRAFSDKDKRTAFEKQKGVCKKCKKKFEITGMEADHITPWSQGGKTNLSNCQMLCMKCNRTKSDK